VDSAPHRHTSAARVLSAAGLTVAAAALELVAARVAGSLFLTADALHLTAHLGIFLVLLLPTSGRHARREDAATCAVLLLVAVIAAWIAAASLDGLLAARPPPRPSLMLASLLGLGANLASAWLFRDPARARWSFRAALAHELADGALTVAGLLGAGAIALWGFAWVDPLLSLAIALWLFAWAMRLLARRWRVGPAAWIDRPVDSHA
jgi:cobalt-zinc-cadmium efflux system protein